MLSYLRPEHLSLQSNITRVVSGPDCMVYGSGMGAEKNHSRDAFREQDPTLYWTVSAHTTRVPVWKKHINGDVEGTDTSAG